MSSWFTTKLLGVRRIFSNGSQLADSDALNFVGFQVTTDPVNGWITVTLSNNTVAGYLGVHNLEADTLLVNGQAEFDDAVSMTAGASVGGGLSVNGGTASDYYTLNADVFDTRILDTTPQSPVVGSAYWIPSGSATWANQITGGLLQIPVRVPNGCVLTAVSVAIDPPSHGTWPIQNAPSFVLKYLDTSSNTVTTVGTVTDSISNQGIYEAYHWVTLSVNHTVDTSLRRYWIELTPESGTNAQTGTSYLATRVVYKRSAGSRIGQD